MNKRCDRCLPIDTTFMCGIIGGEEDVTPEKERVGVHHSFNALEASVRNGCDLCAIIWKNALYTCDPAVLELLRRTDEVLVYSASGKWGYFGPKLDFYNEEAASAISDNENDEHSIDPVFTVHGDWTRISKSISGHPSSGPADMCSSRNTANTPVDIQRAEHHDSDSSMGAKSKDRIEEWEDAIVTENAKARACPDLSATHNIELSHCSPDPERVGPFEYSDFESDNSVLGLDVYRDAVPRNVGHTEDEQCWQPEEQSGSYDSPKDALIDDAYELSVAGRVDTNVHFYTYDSEAESMQDIQHNLQKRRCLSISSYGSTDSSLHSEEPIQSRPRKYDEGLLQSIKLFTPRTIESDLKSLAAEVFQKWFLTCSLEHETCRSDTTSSLSPRLPSRVIDVGLRNQQPRLYVTSQEELQHSEYIALSYCWGAANDSAKTTSLNIDERKISISSDDLPQTLLDAIDVTRSLGQRFLWIDAVCIIQACQEDGDLSDWRSEAPKMGQYYGNAWCTIAAAGAENSSEGFLQPRSAERYSVRRCSLGLSEILDPPSQIEITFPPPMPRWDCDVIHSPLYQRGWTFQEQALSRRLLMFTRNAVYWECASAHWSEFDPSGEIMQLDLSYSEDSGPRHHFGAKPEKRNLKALLSLRTKQELLGRTWTRLVEDYSKMRLTYETDRLIAFAGITQSLQTHHGDQCVMGAWKSQGIRHLVWCRGNDTPVEAVCYQTVNEGVVCPTWSWATLGASVKFPLLHPDPFRGSDIPLYTTDLAEVLHLTDAQSQTTGSVTARIRGFVQTLKIEIDDRDSEYTMDDSWQAYGITALTCDSGEHVQIQFDDPSLRLAHGPQRMRCLLLVRRKGENVDGEKIFFIILKTTKQKPQSYRRIGFGYVESITGDIMEEQDFSPVRAFECLGKTSDLSRQIIELE